MQNLSYSGKIVLLVTLVIVLILNAQFEDVRRMSIEPSQALIEVDYNKPTLQECHARAGWPFVLSKMGTNHGAKVPRLAVTVAFVGGSITAKPDCWVPQTVDMLQRLYPDIEWKGINAGVRGTGAHLGVFRLERDVIAYQPDIIFIEFAVNDNGVPTRVSRSS